MAFALLIIALLVPLLMPIGTIAAQDEEVPIVPIDEGAPPVAVLPDEPVAVVDGEAVSEPVAEAAYDPALDPQAVAVDPAAGAPEMEIAPSASLPAPPPSGAAAAATVEWSPPRTVYIPETGQLIDGVFLDLWRGWGAANGFGYPITPEFEENGRIVQYYGYAKLEYWPDDPNGNVVQFGNLGEATRPFFLRRGAPGESTAVAEAAIAARAWLPVSSNAVDEEAGARYIEATNHSLTGEMRAYWEAMGETSFLGNPLSEQYEVGGITYQVFERGKVAQEPGEYPYLLPIGELVATRYGLDMNPIGQGALPAYSEELFVPPPLPEPSVAAAIQVDPNAERTIQVSISQQYMWARQGDVTLWEGYISTGKPGFDTPTGTFFINSKLPVQDMEGVIGGEYYNVPEVPDVMYFTDRGHAFHGTYWHNNFGAPMSHGCINLPMDVASWVYQWADVGTRVDIVP
ncbi:MAG: L,D-transpeptidase [Chloroflexota bacterium]|nr:L,D-transpeptidase [Chloroflexota bacterium]